MLHKVGVLFITTLFLLCTALHAQPTSGLIAYWSFDDGSAIDDTGNGFDGQIIGSLTTVPGFIGAAFQFPGQSYIEVPGDALGMTVFTERTVSMWIFTPSIPHDVGGGDTSSALISKYRHFRPDISNFYASINLLDPLDPRGVPNRITPAITGVGTNQFLASAPDGLLNEWHHIAFVYKPGTNQSKIYFDCRLLAAGSLTYNNVVSPEPLRIGAILGAGDVSYVGLMDEVRIYDRALSPAEIASFCSTDLVASIAAAPSVVAGNLMLLTSTARNEGSSSADDAAITVSVSSPATTESCSSSSETPCTITGSTATVLVDNLAPGSAEEVYVSVHVPCDVADGELLLGETNVASATPDSAPANNQASVTVAVENPAPVIRNLQVDLPVLGLPNHKMAEIEVDYGISDNCDGAVAVSLDVSSNEPIDELGDGDTEADWEIIDLHHVRLRAERSGLGSDRVYFITVTATDSGGSTSTETVTVTVPHDQKGK